MKIDTVTYLYHGSDREFERFDLKCAKRFKDFGRGMYLTSDIVQAQKWAQRKGEKNNRAYIYQYEFDKTGTAALKILELLEYDKAWIDFICKNRIKGEDSDYDIIYDRIADNQYAYISETLMEYEEHKITVEKATQRLKFSNSRADQFCFKTEKALERLCKKAVFIQYKEDGRWRSERW